MEQPDQSESPPPDELPGIEDAYSPNEASGREVGEDDPDLLDLSARALGSGASQADDEQSAAAPAAEGVARVEAEHDDASDAGAMPSDEESKALEAATPELPNWDRELSAHRIVVELKRIEADVRGLLENRDTKRKRKLSGTRRWLDLEEDVIAWRYAGRFDEDTLRRLQELIHRRHYLFRRLRYLTAARPAGNP
jgi:hypothetical protein